MTKCHCSDTIQQYDQSVETASEEMRLQAPVESEVEKAQT